GGGGGRGRDRSQVGAARHQGHRQEGQVEEGEGRGQGRLVEAQEVVCSPQALLLCRLPSLRTFSVLDPGFRLLEGREELAAGPLAAATSLTADPTVLVLAGVALTRPG